MLPALFTGGPRWMHARQRYTIAFVRRFGRADFFRTMTTNPKWKVITNHLFIEQEPHDRTGLISRVFG